MKKVDLLKLLENVTDEQDVNNVILEHEEFKGNVDLSKLSIDDYKKLVSENETIKGYNQSNIDSAISKAIASHDEKFNKEKLPKILEEELKKRSNEGLTEDQIKLKELEEKLANIENEKIRMERVNKYTKTLTEKGLNPELIDFIMGEDDETINSNIEKITNILNTNVESVVKDKLKASSYTPPTSTNPGQLGKITWEQVQENPQELYSQWVSQNQE